MVCVVFVCMFIGFLLSRSAFISCAHCESSMFCTVFFRWSVATSRFPTIANHYVLAAICFHAFEKSRQPCLLEEGPDHFFNDFHNHHIANRFFMHVFLVLRHFAKVSPWGGSNWSPIIGHPRGTHWLVHGGGRLQVGHCAVVRL